MSDFMDTATRIKKEAQDTVFKRDRVEITRDVEKWFNGEFDSLELHSRIQAHINAEIFQKKAILKRTTGSDEHEYGIGSTIGAMP